VFVCGPFKTVVNGACGGFFEPQKVGFEHVPGFGAAFCCGGSAGVAGYQGC